MKWIAREDGLCLYFLATDGQLKRIKDDRDYHKDEKFFQECNQDSGDNCHIFTLINNGDTKRVIRELRELREKYQSVSWWDKTKSNFKFTQGEK